MNSWTKWLVLEGCSARISRPPLASQTREPQSYSGTSGHTLVLRLLLVLLVALSCLAWLACGGGLLGLCCCGFPPPGLFIFFFPPRTWATSSRLAAARALRPSENFDVFSGVKGGMPLQEILTGVCLLGQNVWWGATLLPVSRPGARRSEKHFVGVGGRGSYLPSLRSKFSMSLPCSAIARQNVKTMNS